MCLVNLLECNALRHTLSTLKILKFCHVTVQTLYRLKLLHINFRDKIRIPPPF